MPRDVLVTAGDVAEHAAAGEYATYQALYPYSAPVLGNNDWYSPGLAAWPWGQWVDVVEEGVRIVGTDTGLMTDPAALAMLATLLTASDLPTVPYLHHPLFSANTRVGGIAGRIRQYLLSVIEAADVDMVISGHSHAHERHEHYGRTFVVIEAGGAHRDQLSASPTLRASAICRGWYEVSASGNTFACRFRDAAGAGRDAFAVTHHAVVPTSCVS